MSERRYTISEIDRMRQAIWNKLSRTQQIIFSQTDNYRLVKRVEAELRTAVLAGVDPDELVASYPAHPSIRTAGYSAEGLPLTSRSGTQ